MSDTIVFSFDDIHLESVHARERFRVSTRVGREAPDIVLRQDIVVLVYELKPREVQITVIDWGSKRLISIDTTVEAVSNTLTYLPRIPGTNVLILNRKPTPSSSSLVKDPSVSTSSEGRTFNFTSTTTSFQLLVLAKNLAYD